VTQTSPGAAAEEASAALALLQRLALDLRWSWNHRSDELWRQLEPRLWERTHNPWALLQAVSNRRLEEMLADPKLRERASELASAARESAAAPGWFEQAHGTAALSGVAYFSMEFMLSEALPIYAGGLGNVAGDQLKAASDLGVPVTGIGLLYQRGYFRQVIDLSGAQRALYPYNDPDQLPVTPLRGSNGERLRLELALPAGPLWLRAWQVQVGRLRLYLLDSNDSANYPAYRGITSELYGGGPELRLQQEIVLGIGGWRLLGALGLEPEVCHLNEGHAALAILERARGCMKRMSVPFDAALAVTRPGNVFTTHTAVPAGFDRFPAQLVEQYLGSYAREELGLSARELLALGRARAHGEQDAFNMAYLAVRGSGAVNAVSRLHGQVSREIFAPLFPRWPASEVPVGHVTNGVHAAGWDSPEADALWTRACGKHRWREGELGSAEERIEQLADEEIWQARAAGRRELVDYARERLAWQLGASGADSSQIEGATQVLGPDALTLGFARRFATYKRPNLLLHDPQRLARLLTDVGRPVQLILAGKAHPEDVPGQALIREWVQFVRREDIRPHAIFLSDYDMLLTERLVQGVDVWINTPRRPWEACGTSGMKVLVNGGLNLSELDGWWAEAYTSEVGWALGDGAAHDDPASDAADAAQLYDLLERQVIPEFYSRDADGIPRRWVARVRRSMAQLTPRFSASRSVREYVEGYYLPAAAAYRERSSDRGASGRRIARSIRDFEHGWPTLGFGSVSVESSGGEHHFTIEVRHGALDASRIQVELYAEGGEGQEPFRLAMMRIGPAGTPGLDLYRADVPGLRPAGQYTARIVPRCANAAVPLEAPYIHWQR
jgi:glycogen phosphorylase